LNNSINDQISEPCSNLENEKKNTAAIYARVSTITQTIGYSLDEQIRQCRERCDNMNWQVRYIFKENGKSGGNLDRPQFQQMMKGAEIGNFNIVVFWKLDRFCRSLVDLVNIERKLKEFGVSLYSITEYIDTTSAIGKFNFRSLASAGELEREMIRERTRMGMKALAIQHKWPGRLPPLGYKRGDDGHLIINTNEAAIVKKIFRLYKKLKSMPEVVFKLNQMNIKTKKGNPWNTMAVKNILTNQIYIGNFKIKDFEDYVKEYRILPNNIFQEAQELRNRYRERKSDMPKDRKTHTVDKFINEYKKYLRTIENISSIQITSM
jgi:site-specific DNA recombinase